MNSQTLHQTAQPKDEQEVKHPFQVVCSVCKKTISYSGKDGEVFLVKCDQCEGI
ncbi:MULTISPECIES: hypothetical protein [Desulfitobacterium]|uniref:Uncharacterized protein n=1 Tax=Desulfitobacterium dehalogenans (strain ATCC 51507 / DSM 9161 / JW/IU-DC1) TaxID=756499 RepID=I4ADW8_DESDJ|nr:MULTISPECIES: hypothetical protein [Desulfitobacterium]AFM02153.1 hypothetical protein Desde_3886 [Desulfitobacterium dehalogenans ATCC 51507]